MNTYVGVTQVFLYGAEWGYFPYGEFALHAKLS